MYSFNGTNDNSQTAKSLKEMLKALFCFIFIMIIRLDTREVKGNGLIYLVGARY